MMYNAADPSFSSNENARNSN